MLDGGTTDRGRPYFVMEHVEGEPIGEYCDRRQLSVGNRLELFQKHCKTREAYRWRSGLIRTHGFQKLCQQGDASIEGP